MYWNYYQLDFPIEAVNSLTKLFGFYAGGLNHIMFSLSAKAF